MKKLLFTVLICLLFIPFVFAENLVEIESIELIDFSDTAKEKTKPTHEGLEMNYDVSFGEVDDFVKYKIVVKNNSDVDYKISEKELFNESHYVKYTYEVGELLKAKSSVEVYLTISYNKEIDEIDFTNGVYEETNKAIVKLLDENNEEVNPNTKSSAIMFIIFGIAILLFLASAGMAMARIAETTAVNAITVNNFLRNIFENIYECLNLGKPVNICMCRIYNNPLFPNCYIFVTTPK